MSRYELGRLLFDASRDRNSLLANRYRDNPDSVLAEYDLTDAEKESLRSRDVRAIYEAGVPPLLVRMASVSLLGIGPADEYKSAIAGAIPRDD